MSRQIITQPAPAPVVARALTPVVPDTYLSKLVKLIPADIVSVYMLLFNMIKRNEGNNYLQWGVFALLVIITPFYLRKVAKIDSTKQIIVCTVSFIIWVFCIGGPVDLSIGKDTVQFYASVFVPIYTLIIPAVYK